MKAVRFHEYGGPEVLRYKDVEVRGKVVVNSLVGSKRSRAGVEPDRIGVMGDSAGAGMAAGVSILARDRGGPAGGPDVPPAAAPARLKDAGGLPPRYIEVGQIDVFRDETTRRTS